MGGEHANDMAVRPATIGSSPRGRGTLGAVRRRRRGLRVIPAWAGNTASKWWCLTGGAGHPRVGGEHACASVLRLISDGSSPRGRGTQHKSGLRFTGQRVIPAWAGNTPSAAARPGLRPGHPRVGGEHMDTSRVIRTTHGSSPRGRGTRGAGAQRFPRGRVIPAWAGNTRTHGARRHRCAGHPRVGGEHTAGGVPYRDEIGSSPRGRGTHGLRTPWPGQLRVIPAWAGNTGSRRCPWYA